MEIKTIAFLEIVTLVLVVVSIVGITMVNRRVGYGEGQIHNATRYVQINTIADALDRYLNLELGSEEEFNLLIHARSCDSSAVPVGVFEEILVPKYIESIPVQGPKNDLYFASYDPQTHLVTVCAPGADSSSGGAPISITR